MKEKMEHEAEQTSGTHIPPKEEPKDVVVTARKALTFIAEMVLIISLVVALFAAIWARWTVAKVAISVFLAVVVAICVYEYLSTTIGKIFKR